MSFALNSIILSVMGLIGGALLLLDEERDAFFVPRLRERLGFRTARDCG
jgi:hypothetical protein